MKTVATRTQMMSHEEMKIADRIMVSNLGESIDKSDTWSESTDLTVASSPSSEGDIVNEESSPSLDEAHTQQQGRRSVRFSVVSTREFNVVEELAPIESDEDEPVRMSLGWEYTEKEIDVDTHIDEMKKERREKYLRLIQDHIQGHISRSEVSRREQEQKKSKKKKGFRSKVLKPLWKGFLEAGSRSSLVMPSPYS
mmetsp:Transcript_12082/g.25737  ORF Transcript_12082/g.25737 Transcript_12082/m.25737 type:complete len:196 (+) Transcript_12082:150-737(+)|eukprot:CAMPEP_0183724264 /NCGR_PEP_ID=MMETSP0737-20130205/17821_1 /TAXON_ID=385413 /ORGANISM="Thalassiosira miniscula, Strain CCMP1093" /LENGTH=195 /DNA_ID=CAMNT_0025954811 /DNA_START=84 /DNA_END=671 /DNA_ORIENTATION=+